MLKNVRLFCVLLIVAAAASAQTFPPAALQQDLRFLRDEIDRIHPQPDVFASGETLRKSYDNIAAQLQQPLTRDEAWKVLSTLNPVFDDAHMFVVQPDWAAQISAHHAAGGALFPYEVQVSAEGDIVIRSELGGGVSALAGQPITQINGVPAARVAQEMLALMAGETRELRAHLLSRRMWFYYWKVFGAPRAFDLVVGMRALRVAGSTVLPASVLPPTFGQQFHFTLLPGKAAMLTINQFLWPDHAAFNAFTKDVFTQIQAAGVTTLLIDVRENTGGDDVLWKDGVLPYIADKPFRNASSYIKKVIAGRASGSEHVGDVVRGFGDSWVAPDLANPLHFSGRTYVLVGRLTYSSAVLFSNVVQDFGFGQLVEAGGYARARQTGGVQNVVLPNTKLEISIPRFIVDRPSGARAPALVRPDIVLPDSPFDRGELVRTLLQSLHGATALPVAIPVR